MSKMEISRTWHGERRCSFFIGTVMSEVTFSRRENSKPVTYFLPGFSSLKRDVGVAQFEMAWPKNSKWWFLDISPKTWHSACFVSACSLLCQRNRMWTQRNIVFEMGWTWLARSWNFSKPKETTATNPENLMPDLPLAVHKKIIFNFSVEPFQKLDPKVLFPGWNSGRFHVTFLEF